MSGCSYDSVCSRCGGKMLCSSDWKPFDMVTGICLDCGFRIDTVTKLATLKEVNEERELFELEPIKNLKQPTQEWIESGYEELCQSSEAKP